MSIGTRIYEERKRLNLSQEYVAEFLHTTKQAVYKYENGIVKNIPTEKIEKLAQLFGVTPQYLIGWEENPADEGERFVKSPEEIGKIVRELRGDVSLRAFAEKCTVSHSTIDNIE